MPLPNSIHTQAPWTLHISTLQIFSPLDIDSLKSKPSSNAKTNEHIPPNPLLQLKFPQKLPPENTYAAF